MNTVVVKWKTNHYVVYLTMHLLNRGFSESRMCQEQIGTGALSLYIRVQNKLTVTHWARNLYLTDVPNSQYEFVVARMHISCKELRLRPTRVGSCIYNTYYTINETRRFRVYTIISLIYIRS